MQDNNIDHVDILKLDAEGAEWEVFAEQLKTHTLKTKVKQVSVEIHINPKHSNCSTDMTCFTKTLRHWYKTLRGLEAEGFVMYDSHKNPAGGMRIPGLKNRCCYEIAYYNSHLWTN